MKITIRAFGIAKDILGNSHLDLEVETPATVQQLKAQLITKYPDFNKLASLAIAVNAEYRNDRYVLNSEDEVVIIPPVSGG